MDGHISSKHKKKRQKRSSHHDGDGPQRRRSPNSNNNSSSSNQLQRNRRGGPETIGEKPRHAQQHQKALDLSQQLRQLSSTKRLKECVHLYYSSANDEIRDKHHGSIVVDCCARCGDVHEAESVVIGMLLCDDHDVAGGDNLQQQRQHDTTGELFFWKEYHQSSNFKRVPIHAWTALLKAYVHSGLMSKADSLFSYLMTASGCGESKERKRKKGNNSTNKQNSPNVRTVNTLLRGCMWTAASISNDCDEDDDEKKETKKEENNKNLKTKKKRKKTIKLVGGVLTAERAWSMCLRNNENDNMSTTTIKNDDGRIRLLDTSSYEYLVTILSQSLRCKDAAQYLDQMKSDLGIVVTTSDKHNNTKVDQSVMESVIVCLVAISRGCILLGDFDQGLERADEALRAMDLLQSSQLHSTINISDTPVNISSSHSSKLVTGGKRAWNDSKNRQSGVNAEITGGDSSIKQDGRREESNKLFRSHRLSELRSEALTLKHLCSNCPEKSIVTHDAESFAHLIMKRLFYFSGGGTTQLLLGGGEKVEGKEGNYSTYQTWIHSLWHSFGLRETMQRAVEKDGDLLHIFPSKKQTVKQLPHLLTDESCEDLRQHLVSKNCDVLTDDGFLNFDAIFEKGGGKARPLHIELGSGSGDWCVTQSKLNPSENYVTVELRADRVAQTFFKCITQNTWKNMCCVGSECGSFLRDRIVRSQCRTIFVNHPEPPTQTFDSESSLEEPAHMLNSINIRLAANSLEGGGKGRLIIVTDNLIYARFLCHTMTHVIADGCLVGIEPSQVQDLRPVDSFYIEKSGSNLWLYEGKPSSSIGHFDSKQSSWTGKVGNGSDSDKGTSWFDRLWRTGAGKHADMKKRYVVALRTCGRGVECGNFSAAAAGKSTNVQKGKKGPRRRWEKKEKKPKKRNAEAQKRRNERRLLKKQQAASPARREF